jgi:hypothetical protein
MDISTLTLGELEDLIQNIKEQLGEKLKPDISFPPGSVPVSFAAKVYGKDPCWIRAGIISGWLPIGTATRDGKQIFDVQEMDSRKGRISYYISPKLLYEQTGCVWKGERG